ncbi:MAG: S41 family peptidase [Gemmatimonadota bacterium]
MRIARSTFAPLVLAAIALVTGGWFLQHGAEQEQNVYYQANLFNEVLHRVSDQFVDSKDPSTLYKMAIDGMLEELGDPHTVLMSKEDHSRLMVETQGEYGGVGMEIGQRDGWITVISPLPGTPAERAGLQAGDRIIEIDGKTTRDMPEDQAVKVLRGQRGTPVELKIARVGVDQPIPFRIVREEIRIKSVPSAYMIDNSVGYVELVRFSERSTDELREAIDDLRAKGMKSLIIDLRRNPGGLLDQGISVADIFLPKGVTVAQTKSRIPSQNQKAFANDADQYPGLPIVVLVGPGSASAAEILAGALQDHDRVLVVGRTTYGKGSVQSIFTLANDNYLKMTTARWFTPVGRSIQRPYGIGFAQTETEPGVLAGADTSAAANDTTRKPAYKTDSGRIVYGGGGIHPDLVVSPDTLNAHERAFYDIAQKQAQAYRTAAFNYAVRYSKSNPAQGLDFEVTDAMLDGFYQQLAQAGVKIPRDIFDNARSAIADDLAAEIAYSQGGQQAWRQRVNTESAEIRVALELLHKANSPKSLFSAANSFEASRTAAVSPKKSSLLRN